MESTMSCCASSPRRDPRADGAGPALAIAALCLAGCGGEIYSGAGPGVEEVWTASHPSLSTIWALSAGQGALHVSADSGLHLFVLGPDKAQLRCRAEIEGPEAPVKAPATVDQQGNVYFTRTSPACLASVDQTCRARWRSAYPCGSEANTRPVLIEGGEQVVLGTHGGGEESGRVLSVQAADGARAWEQALTGQSSIRRSLSAGPGGALFVGTVEGSIGKLYRLSPDDRYDPAELFTAAAFHAPALVTGEGEVIIGDWNKNLFALSGPGDPRWSSYAQGRIISAPAAAGGWVFTAAASFGVYAQRLDGEESWVFNVPGVQESGVALTAGGAVLVGSTTDCEGRPGGGCLYALAGGQLLWRYPTARPIRATPLVHDGLILIGDDGGTIYALRARE